MSQGEALTRARRRGAHYVAVAGDLALQASRQVSARLAADGGGPTLQGDRWVEWSYCFARLSDGPGRTLDFGSDIGFLALAAAQRGHDVVAFDREALDIDYEHERVRAVQGDILTYDFGTERFDQVINCSTVEHVGLSGRYASFDAPDGDLDAMRKLLDVMTPDGRMVLTIPVGQDRVCAPLHRIYGTERLPRLLDGYREDEAQFWAKEDSRWLPASRERALAVQGSESFYALGLFVLRPAGSG
jgi:SAM-dependent methyltransferase